MGTTPPSDRTSRSIVAAGLEVTHLNTSRLLTSAASWMQVILVSDHPQPMSNLVSRTPVWLSVTLALPDCSPYVGTMKARTVIVVCFVGSPIDLEDAPKEAEFTVTVNTTTPAYVESVDSKQNESRL